jgi:hypothetical protein
VGIGLPAVGISIPPHSDKYAILRKSSEWSRTDRREATLLNIFHGICDALGGFHHSHSFSNFSFSFPLSLFLFLFSSFSFPLSLFLFLFSSFLLPFFLFSFLIHSHFISANVTECFSECEFDVSLPCDSLSYYTFVVMASDGGRYGLSNAIIECTVPLSVSLFAPERIRCGDEFCFEGECHIIFFLLLHFVISFFLASISNHLNTVVAVRYKVTLKANLLRSDIDFGYCELSLSISFSYLLTRIFLDKSQRKSSYINIFEVCWCWNGKY